MSEKWKIINTILALINIIVKALIKENQELKEKIKEYEIGKEQE